MELSQAIRELDDEDLLEYIQEEIENKGKQKDLMELIVWDPNSCARKAMAYTSLQMVLYHGRCKKIIFKLIELGGRELVMMKSSHGENVLKKACESKNASLDIISKLIEVGGRELLVRVNENSTGETALHKACWNEYFTLEGIIKLIEAGGKELVMMSTHYCEYTALHYACMSGNTLLDVISKLIEVGGKELVMATSKDGETALHFVCKKTNSSPDVVSKLIEIGGRELLMANDRNEQSALHIFFTKRNSPGLLSQFSNNHFEQNIITFTSLLKECIIAGIGGESGIGGLFNVTSQLVQHRIYEKWDQLLPVLVSITELLQEHQTPILHAAIIAKAPSRILQSIINHFEYAILTTDSSNRYPIQAAVEGGLVWSNGLQEIIEATALAQQQYPSIYTAAQYGLKWSHHMKELVEANVNEMMSGCDRLTGLHLFMIAAMGDCHDLSAIFGMMRMNPCGSSNNMLL